jgi:hypothetical protein
MFLVQLFGSISMEQFKKMGLVDCELQWQINFAVADLIQRKEIPSLTEKEKELATLLEAAKWLTPRNSVCLGSLSIPVPTQAVISNNLRSRNLEA